jgi:hypothetical protein
MSRSPTRVKKDGLEVPEKAPVCGIVMPMSAIDGCGADHWEEVLAILEDVAETAGFEPNLVSTAEEVGVIQKRIVENLHQNPIVVCDVSGRNPNVMFELGLRLAFDKPTIIVKDDKTIYAFDTSPIEHLPYPRDLRFPKIVTFKALLAAKLQATLTHAAENPEYSPFLGHFGPFKVAAVETKVVPGQEFIIDKLAQIEQMIQGLSIHRAFERLSHASAKAERAANIRLLLVRGGRIISGLGEAELQELQQLIGEDRMGKLLAQRSGDKLENLIVRPSRMVQDRAEREALMRAFTQEVGRHFPNAIVSPRVQCGGSLVY